MYPTGLYYQLHFKLNDIYSYPKNNINNRSMYCRNWRTYKHESKTKYRYTCRKSISTISVNLSNKINEKSKLGFY